MNFSDIKKGIVFTSLGAIFWGINGVVASFLFSKKGITANWISPYRLFFAGFFLLIFLFLKKRRDIFKILNNKNDFIKILIFGIFGMLGTQYTYFTTIQYSNAGIATVLQYFGPTLILIFVCLKEKRKAKFYEIISLVFSSFGVFLLATHGSLKTLQISPQALFWGMLSAFALVVYTVQPVKLLKKYGTPITVAWGMLFGGIVLFFLKKPWEQNIEIDFTIFISLLFIIFCGTIFAFLFYLSGVKLIGPTKSSLVACTEPVIATLGSVIFLKTPFEILDFIGFLFIMSTVFIVAYYGEKQNEVM